MAVLIGTATAGENAFTNVPDVVHPGKSERISFRLEKEEKVTLSVMAENGETVAVIRQAFTAPAGENHMIWDGLKDDGTAAAPGEYSLVLSGASVSVSRKLTIGNVAPQILSVSAPGKVTPGDVWSVTVNTNMEGTLSLYIRLEDGQWHLFMEENVPQGESLHY